MNQQYDGLDATMARVYGEFVEMPCLQLTLEQAQRLFGLGESGCAMVLDSLVECQILVRLSNGKYTRDSGETRTPRTAATDRHSQQSSLLRVRRDSCAGSDGHPSVR